MVVDINENGLTELVIDLRSSTEYNIPSDFINYPVNFGDRVFEKIFQQHGPFQIVANFAAHKHVRSEIFRFFLLSSLHVGNIHLLSLLKVQPFTGFVSLPPLYDGSFHQRIWPRLTSHSKSFSTVLHTSFQHVA